MCIRVGQIEERLSENKNFEITQCGKKNKQERKKMSEERLHDMWDSTKWANIRITGIPERERTRNFI